MGPGLSACATPRPDHPTREGAPQMNQQARPARPHTGLTEDGRRLAQVLTYARRGNRLTDRQAEAWGRHSDRWWIPEE